MIPNRLLPVRYDKELGNEINSRFQEAKRAQAWETLKIYTELRTKHTSAVIELNFARASLNQLKNRQGNINQAKKSITSALNRARYLIEHDRTDRYPINIGTYVTALEQELQEFG